MIREQEMNAFLEQEAKLWKEDKCLTGGEEYYAVLSKSL